jgi:hypothetical protein
MIAIISCSFAKADTQSAFFSPMTFTFEQDDLRPLDMGLRQTVYAQGEITPGTANRFLSFLRLHNVLPGEEVMLNSPGGSLIDGMAIGEIIRNQKLNTEVGVQGDTYGSGGCYSSCTLAFLGGVSRYVDSTSQFGVHQFSSSVKISSDQAFNASQEISGEILNYIINMGVAPDFFTEMSISDPSQINILSQDELHKLNVITPVYTTTWDLKAISQGVYFRGTVDDIRGVHKFIFLCPTSDTVYPTLGIFIEADDDSNLVVETTKYIDLVFDNSETPLLQSEIIRAPAVDKNDVVLLVQLSPRLMSRLRNANTLGIELIPPSHMTFVGFTADLSTGKDQLFNFLSSCRH